MTAYDEPVSSGHTPELGDDFYVGAFSDKSCKVSEDDVGSGMLKLPTTFPVTREPKIM